jgi:transposase-like protein
MPRCKRGKERHLPMISNQSTLNSINGTARLLGISPMSLWRWIKQYQIPTAQIANVTAVIPSQVQAILIANGKLAGREVNGE